MRILLVHTFYQQWGGENQVYEMERDLLINKGHNIIPFTLHNDQIPKMNPIRVASLTIWNQHVYNHLRSLINKEKPDLVHFHNTFPLISPSAYYAAKHERLPVIQRLPNYRLFCPNGLLYRDGKICEECLGKRFSWPGIVHACYRNSYAASTVTSAMLAYHWFRETWEKQVDIFIALTKFSRQKFIEGGLPEEKIITKPNFVNPDPGPRKVVGDYAIFAGRLSSEKGVKNLVNSWQSINDIPLKIVGEGPQYHEIKSLIQEQGIKSIEMIGHQSRKIVLKLIKQSRFLIFSSECYENFPNIIVEAFACGVPIIANRIGSVSEIVKDRETGLHFSFQEPGSLREKVNWAWAHPKVTAIMGERARRVFETDFTAEQNYKMIMEIYHHAITQSKKYNGQIINS